MRRDLVERLVLGGGRRWPWAVAAGAGLLGVIGAVAPWIGPSQPWGSNGIHRSKLGVRAFPHDARQCPALAAFVVIVGVAGWFGARGLLPRLLLVVSGAVVAFIPFAAWVWLGSTAPSPPPEALARFMDRLPLSPSIDAARHYDTSSRGWGLTLTTIAGLLIVAAALVPARWPGARSAAADLRLAPQH